MLREGFRRLGRAALAAALLLLAPAALAAPEVGTVTKLPIPRYVSLKTDRVNLREGPSKDHRTSWVFQRAGLPVEIVAEFETWRRIRDAEGTEGWVLHSLLSGRRTALVMPWAKGEVPPLTLHARADERAETVARLQPSVIVNVRGCSGVWCRVTVVLAGARDVEGFIRQDRLWGVYPNERVE
ncbi:MAG TPA: SH3 domain-containing protein [Salinarimonas sp.]|nr:SH3 domain-containing protein [Salinarimonas sp.]